jgi:DNA-binding PadR family transcriptional regulator
VYELLVLSLLMDWPLHAYLIADIANSILGPWERISRGTLSSLLVKLERAGLIAPADPATVPFPTRRPSRALAITPAGRERFRQLMLDTTSNPGTYSRLFRLKALHLHLLEPAEQLDLLDHYIAYCQTGRRYQEQAARDMAANPLKQEHTPAPLRAVALDLMATTAQQWELEAAWARRLRDRVTALAAPGPAPHTTLNQLQGAGDDEQG